ncbi:hypothetical protein QJ854_gp818 [Moumouvirus goulette]|uniref:Uncharacterized protein n=1 Tax=Moumouvirus goulette TaxID=1247379 RepID=M1PAU5_9VIRU|nr:hypothetical protein QJ854_gp818 [Moumouvirus goulette]AGF84964.1 hypothetical protein glt_00155 [Moumouvirus goulette]
MYNMHINKIDILMEKIHRYIINIFICFVCVLFFIVIFSLGNPIRRISLKNKEDITKCYRYMYCYDNLCICEDKDVLENLYCWNKETCYMIKFKECGFNIIFAFIIITTLLLRIKTEINYLEKATPEERVQLLDDLNQQFIERSKIHYYDNYGNLRVKMPGDSIPSYCLF